MEKVENIVCITPTGDVPLAFKRCQYYLERQTVKPTHWIISDSSKHPEPFESTLNTIYLRQSYAGNKAQDFRANLNNLVKQIPKKSIIFVIESDDWYSPKYIEKMLQRIERYDLVGESRCPYYNVKTRSWRINNNKNRASLCCTVFRSKLLEHFKHAIAGGKSAFVDSRFWNYNSIRNKQTFEDKWYCIGIKGMPGRPGIGIGHRPPQTYRPDLQMLKLEEFIGKEDTEWYQKQSL